MGRPTNAERVWRELPAMGEEPLPVQKISQQMPLTLQQVSDALQQLKMDGRAVNPRGPKTSAWTRHEEIAEDETHPEPVDPAPTPHSPAQDADARVQEVERHLARIEGALAGMSSRLGEVQDALDESTIREERLVELVEHLASELGSPSVTVKNRTAAAMVTRASMGVPRAV